MLDALRKTLGNVTQACKMINLARKTHYQWINTDEKYKHEVESIEEEAIDYVESQLFRNIQNGDRTSIIFYLKCKAKQRGYIDKQIVEVEGDTTFNVKFNGEDEEDDE